MKLILILLFIIGFMPLDAQTVAVSITVEVTDCKTHEAIEGAVLRLFGDDGSVVDMKSDKKGVYNFDSNRVKSGRMYILRVLSPDAKHSDLVETIRIEPSNKDKNFNYDLCLEPSKGCTLKEDDLR